MVASNKELKYFEDARNKDSKLGIVKMVQQVKIGKGYENS